MPTRSLGPTEEAGVNDYVLVYSGGSRPESQEEVAQVMKAWDTWMRDLGDKLKDGGNPFTPMAKSVAPDGKVSDGPIGGMATGYSILQADSMDEAVDIAKTCPVNLGGASITVYETFKVM
jgi:hypothetical protein